MTSMTERPPQPTHVTALCCECGTTRTVSRRASGHAGNRTLRCETCRKTTAHAAIGADRFDWREDLDHAKPPKLSAADKLDVLRSLGVDIDYEDTLEAADGSRTIVSLWWWLDEDNVFLLVVNRDSTDAERDEKLTAALEFVAEPRYHRWFIETQWGDGPVAHVAFTVRTGR